MPSMHVGYTFLFALTLVWLCAPRPGAGWRCCGPPTMLFAVVSTANHWILDGVGGVTAVLLALRSLARCAAASPCPWH